MQIEIERYRKTDKIDEKHRRRTVQKNSQRLLKNILYDNVCTRTGCSTKVYPLCLSFMEITKKKTFQIYYFRKKGKITVDLIEFIPLIVRTYRTVS